MGFPGVSLRLKRNFCLITNFRRTYWEDMNIFWSYAKLDNKNPQKLTRLRRSFNISLDQTTGFENKIIVDESDLKWGVDWKKEISRLISESDAVITIISPSYFNSRMCIYELDVALKADKGILPIYYRNCPKGLRSSFKEEGNEENARLNEISSKISGIQYKDFRALRNKELESEVVQDFLDEIAEEIA
jgi:hypothetical protein